MSGKNLCSTPTHTSPEKTGSGRQFSIKLKIFIVLTVMISIIGIVNAFFIGRIIKKDKQDSFALTVLKELLHIENNFNMFIADIEKTINIIASHPAVRNADDSIHSYIEHNTAVRAADVGISTAEKNIMEYFKLVFEAHKEYDEIYLGTVWGGHTTASGDALPARYDPRKRPWYTSAAEKNGALFISPAYLSTTGNVVVAAARTAYANSGTMVGVAGIDVSLQQLVEMINQTKIGKSGYVMLVQDDGVILADPRHKDFCFKTMHETGIADFTALNKSPDGTAIIHMNNKSYTATIHTIALLNWKLIAFIETAEITEEFQGILKLLAFIAAILLTLFSIISFFLINYLIRPLSAVVRALKDIAQGEGDLTVRLPVSGNDEITDLSAYFNRTIDKIGTSIKAVGSNSEEMAHIGTELANNMAETAGSIQQIGTNIDAVRQQTLTQAASVTETAATIEQIIRTIKQLNTSIEHQSASVTESSAAIEQMVGNIVSITQTLEKTDALLKHLQMQPPTVKKQSPHRTMLRKKSPKNRADFWKRRMLSST